MTRHSTFNREQAYIDRELTSSEMMEMEEHLSEAQQEELQSSRIFQSLLGQKLESSAPKCPKEIWNGILSQIHSKENSTNEEPQKSTTIFSKFTSITSYGSAAATLAALLILAWFLKPTEPQPLFIDPVAYIQNHQFSHSGSSKKMEAALHHAGFFLELNEGIVGKHPVQIVGLDIIDKRGEKEARVVYSCCDQPILITIRKGTSPSLTIPNPSKGEAHFLSKQVDQYTVQAYSYHNPKEALDMIY
jgi:hypothetical protein